jgi:hypothetical protein
VRTVLEVLVAGVGVDRGHQALDDAELVVKHLGHRSQAVGRAGRVGDHVVAGRVVVVVVDAHDDGDVLVLRGRGDDHLLRTALDVRLGLGRVGEEARGLHHDVDAQVAPGQGRGVLLGEDLQGLVADPDAVVGHRDVLGEPAEDRVVVEQVGHGGHVTEVVGGDDLDVGAHGVGGTVEVAADAAEAVDTNADSHSDVS